MFRKICAIVLLFCAFAGTGARAEEFSQRFIAANPVNLAPPMTFEDAGGRSLTLKDFAGRYVLLNLWATWCAPCVHELPALDSLQSKIPANQLTVVALTEDVNGRENVQSFYDRHGIHNLAIYADGAGMAPSSLRAHGLPTTFLIDPQGRVLGSVEGNADWAAPDAVAFLKSRMGR